MLRGILRSLHSLWMTVWVRHSGEFSVGCWSRSDPTRKVEQNHAFAKSRIIQDSEQREWRANPEKVFCKYAELLVYGLPHYRCLGLLFHAFKSFTLFYFVKLSFIFSALLRRSLVSLGQPTQNPPQWRIKIIMDSNGTWFRIFLNISNPNIYAIINLCNSSV